MRSYRDRSLTSRPHQLKEPILIPKVWLKNYIPAVIIGALGGLGIGFAVYQMSGGSMNIVGFVLEFHRGRDAMFWIFGGALIAGAITFLCAPNAK